MFVARHEERQLLRSAFDADSSQFIAVYGRRRIGKTLLVREAFNRSFTFQHAGLANSGLRDQLSAFSDSLREAGLNNFNGPTDWREAFELLKNLIRASEDVRKVIFIDELSWMDTPRSDLMTALESFWNGWASARTDVVLIVCASATSWMLDNVIHNKGGLYNRLTAQIGLRPFTLSECEQLIRAKGIRLNRHQIIECYMVFGGVPYYWDLLQKHLGLSQNMDRLFFTETAPLANEYRYLFSSLFRHPDDYLTIVTALGKRKAGMTRKEIAETTGLANSGSLSSKLEELQACGFIRRYRQFGKRRNGAMYQLIDNFVLFHYKFLDERSSDEHFWTNAYNSSSLNAWRGLAFERVCLEHVPQIKRALGISGVQTDVCAWTCEADDELGVYGSQIDLLIVRKDQTINLCEMKYTRDDYVLTGEEARAIRRKVSDFLNLTKTRSAVQVTLVTPFGLKRNTYADEVQALVTANDLFS